MKVAFVRPLLKALDEVTADAVLLSVFVDERPLRGLAGLVDWRLNGRLSHWVARERFKAARGETLLYPDRGRLTFDRVLLVGLGDSQSFDATVFPGVVRQSFRAARDLGARRIAAALPGRELLSWNPRQVVEAFLSAARDVFLTEPPTPTEVEILLVEEKELERTAVDTVTSFVRRLRR